MRALGRLILLTGVATLAACIPQREAPPTQQQPQAQRPAAPRPLPPPPPAPADWRDLPLTPGAWVYSQQGGISQALFGAANSAASFIVRCDRPRNQVALQRGGAPTAATMTLRTSYTARALPVAIQGAPLSYATAEVAPRDPILDSIAFSRGRFTVEAPGLPMLVIPAWPEPARVIEDCRG